MPLLAALVLGAGARPECAYACSCAPLSPARALADPQVPALLVGVVIDRREEHPQAPVMSSADPAFLTIRVERSLKAALPEQIEVRTASDGASCGIEAKVGTRLGLVLDRDGETWRSGLCSQLDPDELLDLADESGWTTYAPVVEDEGPLVNWGGVVVGVVVVGAGALLLARRLRRRAA